MSARRAVTALLLVAVVGVLAGCNLPHGTAGAKCSPVGKGAQDGTYLLTCNKNHRYQRVMTIAQGNALWAAYLAAHATTTTAPPPPPAPPTTTFGAGSYPVGTTAGHVPPGVYTANAGPQECSWRTIDAGGTLIGSNPFDGIDFMQIGSTAATVIVSGPCTWSPAPSTPVAIPADGTASYRVGLEVAPGWYHIAGGPECFWEIDSTLDGSLDGVEGAGFSTGSNLLFVASDDAELQVRDCGPLTPRATPTRFVSLEGSSGNSVLDDDSVGYDQTDATITATLSTTTTANDTLTIGVAGYTIVLTAPTGSTLAGAHPKVGAPGSSAGGVSVSGGGHTCVSDGTGSYSIPTLTQSAGVVTQLTGSLGIQCTGGTTITIGDFHIG